MRAENESRDIGLFVKMDSVPSAQRGISLVVPLQSLHYDVQIVQNVARIELVQHYRNLSPTFLEAEYFFPVRTHACISDFRAEFDGRVVRGIVKEKEEARQEYRERRERGDLVAYSEVKEETPDVMKILIGNIPPMGEVKITFVHVEELKVSVN
jgi:Ca-activated chloride channel family protein